MYVTSENVWTGPGVGGPGFGQLVASAALQNITVIVTCLVAITSGASALNLDLLLGDNQNANLNPNTDTSWASGAVSTGITVPTAAGASASAVVAGRAAGGGAHVETSGAHTAA